MTEYTPIPNGLIEAESYKSLAHCDRAFLIELYYKFGDCETFTIDFEAPVIAEKVRRLRKANLIAIVDEIPVMRKGPKPKVYAFVHSAVMAY